MSIWPDVNNELRKLTDLCDPRSRSIAAILQEALRIPHEQVRRSKLAVVGGNPRSLIRRVPQGQNSLIGSIVAFSYSLSTN